MNQASVIWLALSDSSLQSFYESYLSEVQVPVVHFSGALHFPKMTSAHPLMSFPVGLMPNSIYSRIHFVLSNGQTLKNIMPGFSNTFTALQENHKNNYHALCVIAGNFPQLLWAEVLPEFEKMQIPAFAIETYIRQISENFIEQKQDALTGPLIRNDQTTIEMNMRALKNLKLKKIYNSFVEVFNK